MHILVTSYSHTIEDKCEEQSCFDAMIKKPISPSKLNNALEKLEGETNLPETDDSMSVPTFFENKTNILLVEDNAINQELMLDILENIGLDVDIAENGSIALKMITKKNGQI